MQPELDKPAVERLQFQKDLRDLRLGPGVLPAELKRARNPKPLVQVGQDKGAEQIADVDVVAQIDAAAVEAQRQVLA